VRIGRDPALCNLTMNPYNTKLSKAHLEVRFIGDEYEVRDLWTKGGSYHGTSMMRIPSERPLRVEPGTHVHLADESCGFRLGDGR